MEKTSKIELDRKIVAAVGFRTAGRNHCRAGDRDQKINPENFRTGAQQLELNF